MIVVAFAAGGVLLAFASMLLWRILPQDIPAPRTPERTDMRPQALPAQEPKPIEVQRMVTGTIAALLGVLALLAFIAAVDVAGTDPWAAFGAVALGISLLIVAAPFFLATFLPPGRLRRVVVGFGASLLMSAVVLVAVVMASHSRIAVQIAVPLAFVLAFYAAFRLAR